MPKTRRQSLRSFAALLAYRNRPEGPVEPLQTNWTSTPANDNAPEDTADAFVERRLNSRPTLSEIKEAIACGDVEYGPRYYPDDTTDTGIVRIGTLRFSDGRNTERAYRRTIDGDLVAYDERMPVGAMLGASEKQERILGGEENAGEVSASDRHFAALLGFDKVRARRPGGKGKVSKLPHSARLALQKELQADIEIRGLQVTRCPAGLPLGGTRIADGFVGMKVASTGSSGSQRWQDISTAFEERQTWAAIVDALPKGDLETLDAAMTARNLAELGGEGSRRAAEKRGKARLQAANDNIEAAIKKFAA